MDNILAVDPGGDTGLAMFSYPDKIWKTTVLPYEPLVLYGFFISWLTAYKGNATVIGERFDYRPVGKYNFGGSKAIPKVDLTPREVIGILKLACAQYDVEIVWQSPGDVNGKDDAVFWTDAKVKHLGLYKPGHVHEMDAVKHILYYRAFKLSEQDLYKALKPDFSHYVFEEVMT